MRKNNFLSLSPNNCFALQRNRKNLSIYFYFYNSLRKLLIFSSKPGAYLGFQYCMLIKFSNAGPDTRLTVIKLCVLKQGQLQRSTSLVKAPKTPMLNRLFFLKPTESQLGNLIEL